MPTNDWYNAERSAKTSEVKRKQEEDAEKRRFKHDWKIAIFSSFMGAFFSVPLWAFLGWIFDLLKKTF